MYLSREKYWKCSDKIWTIGGRACAPTSLRLKIFGTIIQKVLRGACSPVKHSPEGFAYLEHLFNKFSYLCTSSASVKKTDRKLFNTSSYYFVTRQLRAITELHTLFYRTPPPAGRPRLGAARPPRGEGRKVRIKAVPIQVLNESER